MPRVALKIAAVPRSKITMWGKKSRAERRMCVVEMSFFLSGLNALLINVVIPSHVPVLNGETSPPRRSTVAPHQFCVQLSDGKGRNKKEQTKQQRGGAISQLQEKVLALPTFSINRRENLPFLALTLT